MTTNPARVVVLAAAAALVVCGCASVKITAPATDAVVMLPSNTAPTTVAVTSSSNISNLMVTADGTDVSNQVTYSSATGAYTGALSLAPGSMHTVVASGDVYCSYCTGQQYHSTDTTTFCVAGPPSAVALPTKIAFAQADDNSGSAIVLAACDNADQRQHWEGTRQQLSSGKGFYRFTNRAVAASGANWGCLTEGSGGTLIQSNCSDTTDRLWSVFNNGLNSFEAGNMPW